MKKIVAVLISLSIILLTSCKKEDNSDILYTPLERFTYEKIDLNNSSDSIFGIDDNNILYVPSYDENGQINIKTYDENGDFADTISFNLNEDDDVFFSLKGIDIYDGKIFILCNFSNIYKICIYDINEKKLMNKYSADDFSYIEKIEANTDGVYILGTPKSGSEHISEKFTDENKNEIYFEYDTKIIARINKNGDIEGIEAEDPIAFTAKSETGIIIYSFDKTGGYYFAEINNNSPQKKAYNNAYGLLSDIDIFGSGSDIIVCGVNNHKLCAGTADENSGISDVLENVFVYFPEDVKCNSDNIFFKSGDNTFSETKKLYRINSAAAVHKGKINVISSQFVAEMPFSNGYEINSEQLSADMFSTKILTMSDSFDVSIFSSAAGYAKNMQSSGAYYPLNDIEGVEEYIDGCFPYLKNACTNEKGQIWALPINVDIPVIVYNKFNCKNAGFEFNNNMTLGEFSKIVYNANENNLRYDCIRYRFTESMLAQYLQNNDSFDTAQFRELAVFLKEKCSAEIFKFDPLIYSDLMVYNVEKQLDISELSAHPEYDGFYFTMLTNSEEQTKYLSEDENLSAVPLPKISSDYKNNAVCTFLCINPGAGNLENAKNYISALTSELENKKNGMMLRSEKSYTNNDYCKALREIYSDGQVYFAVPESIYYEGFDSYCAGGTDLETLIRDADEKMKIYLWEKG